MNGDSRGNRPERATTDDSLRNERKRTDRAIAERRADAEQEADLVLERARTVPDAVLSTAREQADQAGGETGAPLVASRAQEDDALRGSAQQPTIASARPARRRNEPCSVSSRWRGTRLTCTC